MPRAVKTKAGVGGSGANAAKKAPAAKRNKLYSMPEKIAEGTLLTDLSKVQWRIGPSIGTGGFGEIYSACRVGEKNYDYVVKCEPHGNGPLFVEMHFYMRNARLEDIERFKREHGLKCFGMPYMIGNGSVDIKGVKHRFIVMPRYGSDVARHYLANGRCLPEGTIYRLALQMLDVYEFVHSCGYVHADLKAANILLGHGKGGGAQAYLVDYGLASHYTTKEFKPDPKKMHNGTIEYTSRDAHQGVATMRADLEILGYNMIEWCGVQLPWVKQNLLAVPTKVQKAKEEFMADVVVGLKGLFPKGVPGPIAEFMKYVAKMRYNEQPDYEKCRKIFTNALKVMRIANTGDLDFKTKADNNNTTPSTSKARTKIQPQLAAVESSVSSMCASDDDDDDVIFEQKKPIKMAPHKTTLKTSTKTNVKATKKDISPRKILSPHKKTHTLKISPKVSPVRKAVAKKISPTRRPLVKTSNSPLRKRRTPSSTSPPTSSPNKRAKAVASDVASSSSSTPITHTTRSTPLSAKTNINFSPAISSSRSSAARPGKTIVNDNTTPNPRAGKTYEFNFELDVSMDANVIVNVKRKKKAATAAASTGTPNAECANGSTLRRHATAAQESSNSPLTRVKVRKIASGDEASGSPRTPAVTVKKSKRVVTPR